MERTGKAAIVKVRQTSVTWIKSAVCSHPLLLVLSPSFSVYHKMPFSIVFVVYTVHINEP